MNNAKPYVSIGMPVYNGERYLETALISLLSQDFRDFELIISDNASTDRTQEICLKYAQQDSRIIYHRNSINEGFFNNFNKVFHRSKADFFMWAACDDLWSPHFLSVMLDLLKKNKTAAVAFPAVRIFDDDNPDIKDHPHLKDYPYMFQMDNKEVYERLRLHIIADDGKSNIIYGLMRSDILRKTKCYSKRGRTSYGADNLLILELLNFGEAVHTKEVLFQKRIAFREEDPSIISRLNRFVSNRWGKLDCFFAYIPIINSSSITKADKNRLKIILVKSILAWGLYLPTVTIMTRLRNKIIKRT